MNIVIVGGGTAGWLAAYFIQHALPNQHNITVIESSKIGIIGAGEGSTGSMVDLLNGIFFDSSISIEEFLKETDGTIKLGIYHKNWTGDNKGYLAPIDCSDSWANYEDNIFKYVLSKYGPEKMHLATPLGQLYAKKQITHKAAVHFDGHKVGKFFKKICLSKGATHIDSIVKDINLNKLGGISSLILDDNSIVAGDFFIDCSGLSRILMKKLNIAWHSYKEILTVNTAMPFILPYDNDTPNPFTSATALSSGWMWEIPLRSRKGCGYVFDNNYISQEEAQLEIEQFLGKSISPIKFINFESGRSEKFWHQNTLCLGLASSFVEPLEATSIHTTIIQLLFFCKEYLNTRLDKTVTDSNIRNYNQQIARLYDLTMDFISFHYQGGREDSNFWKSIKNNNRISANAEAYKNSAMTKIPGFLSINGMIGSPAACLWNYIAAGIGIITPQQALDELKSQNRYLQTEKVFNSKFKNYLTYTL